MMEWIQTAWTWLGDTIFALGYPGIFGLMTLESSFFPFPSEVVMPPGGALARAGDLHLILVILAGTLGSLAGALFNYWFACKLGRPFFLRYGKYILVPEKKFRKVESVFRRHGEIATFIGRLVPGVRQVISFPAGLARMDLKRFCFFTALGAVIWSTVLTMIGYTVGKDITVVKDHVTRFFYFAVPGMVILVVAYVVWYRRWQKKHEEAEEVGS